MTASATVELARPPAALEVPRVLPVKALSAGSLKKFERCPAQWKAHYVDKIRDPVSYAMAAGSAFGSAMAAYFQGLLAGVTLSASDVDDRLVAELRHELKTARAQKGEERGRTIEGSREALRVYLEEIAPGIRPLATERKAELQFPGAEWTVVAYLDLETEDDEVVDYKMAKSKGGKHVTEHRAKTDPQPSHYLLSRWLEGAPAAGFKFHSGLTHNPKTARRWEVVPAQRSETALLAYQARLAMVARAIARCHETGDWPYSTEGWWCGARCPAWSVCPAGGGS